MPWIRKIYTGDQVTNLLDNVLKDAVAYVTDSAHGADTWQLIRQQNWPYGTVLKIPNRNKNEYGYVALMTDKLRVGKSYFNWFKQKDVMRKNFVFAKNGLKLNDEMPYSINDNCSVTVYTQIPNRITIRKDPLIFSDKYSLGYLNSYRFAPQPEIFTKDADVLFFSTFKQYQADFDFNDLMGNARGNIKIKALKYYANGQVRPSFLDPPLYPGVGSPAIGFSPEFLSAADEAVVYIHKERHYLDIVINVLDNWEVASVGFFDAFDTSGEYSFPAMAIGGTCGVMPLTELVSNGGPPIVEHGFRLDYTEKNWSLSHGIPTFASSWWDGTQNFLDKYLYSQVQAMLPEGNWQSFANFGLQQDAFYRRDWGLYFSGHKEPERINHCRYYITPNFTDISQVTNLIPTGKNNMLNTIDSIELRNKQKYQLEPLYLVQCTEHNNNQNILGKIPSLYWCSQPVTRYGEYNVDGKMYLVVPNAWENRKYHIRHSLGSLIGQTQTEDYNLQEIERIEKLSRAMNCVIALGE